MSKAITSSLSVRVVAAVVGIGMVLSFAGVYAQSAHGQTSQEQIAALLAQIAQLQAQLTALQGGSGGSALAGGCPWTRNLTNGSSGADVQGLQQFLNGRGHQVAASGPGSPGQESQFFGPLTRTAVTAYQNANAASVLTPLGLSSGTGFFGASSRAHANSVCSTGTPTPPPGPTPPPSGGEGGITVTQRGSPANGVDLEKGGTAVISAFDVEADDNSAMNVNRVDLNFSVRPWLYLTRVALLVDGSVVAEKSGLDSSDFNEITDGSDYRLRFANLGHQIAAGAEDTFQVEATAISVTDKADVTITLTHKVDSVRASDGLGLQHEEPSSAFTRTFDFESEDAANLVNTLHPDDPDDAIVVDITDTGTTDDVVLCEFQIESEKQSAFLNGVDFNFNSGSSTAVSSVFEEVRIEDANGNILETATSVQNTATRITGFDPDVSLPKDQKVHLRLVAKVKDQNEIGDGYSASATLVAASTDAEDDDFDSIAVANRGSNVVCEDRHFYKDAPIITFVSSSVTGIDDGSGNVKKADAKIEIKVAAQGQDIYLLNFANGGWIASDTPTQATTTGTFTKKTGAATEKTAAWLITAGTASNFEFTGRMDNVTSGGGDQFYKLDTASITWNTSDSASGATTFTFGLDDFESPEIFLED